MSKVYDIITERIIERLEAGTVPWRKTWSGGVPRWPRNLKSGAHYRGINVFLLSALGYDSPYWVTFKQAKALGGTVRKGEVACPVIFWNWREKETDDGKTDRRAYVRYYRAFNVAQCDGLEVPELVAPQTDRPFSAIEACEALVANMPSTPAISHGGGRAFYRPSTDTVRLPLPGRFDSEPEYYSTLFHELTHSTGHEDRLARKGITDGTMRFGSHEYSKEELVAEMGSAFLCGLAGIETAVLENQAAYIQGWLTQLRGDNKLVVHAAAQAQKAADYITGKEFPSDRAR